MSNTESIIQRLYSSVRKSPYKTSFIKLNSLNDVEEKISYEDLLKNVEILSKYINCKGVKRGDRLGLMYTDYFEFIIAFLACQYCGGTAVPIYVAKSAKKNEHIINLLSNAKLTFILSTSEIASQLIDVCQELVEMSERVICTDNIDVKSVFFSSSLIESALVPDEHPVFIQYTSGSTGDPKGVIISNENLMHNLRNISETFFVNDESIIFSWLPFYHDMGLVGVILESIYAGSTCILLDPVHFLQTPSRWLLGISKFKATHSGGPNFAYDMCLEIEQESIGMSNLDLSSWKVAFIGADFVNSSTIRRFSRKFETFGFNKNSIFPCYGLAEATLLVSGMKSLKCSPTILFEHNNKRDAYANNMSQGEVVSLGRCHKDLDIKIISLDRDQVCGDSEEGEICVYGPNIFSGYFGLDNNSKMFLNIDGLKYFKTGDLGFVLQKELYFFREN